MTEALFELPSSSVRRVKKRPYRPSRRGLMIIAGTGVLAFALAAYMRYGLVEPSSVGLVCDAGAPTVVCIIRRVFIKLFMISAFGIGALAASALALIRPSTVMVAAALALGVMGAVLYNTGLASVALSVLPLVLARRAPAKEFQPD